ncbi:MAG: nicotinamide riboside transporter PnuC [Desulfuromonadales bacterium]
MTSPLEIVANLVNAVSIILAGRNSVHTWWTGIIGGVLFGVMFYEVRLYADVTLQLFFIITSVSGWWCWLYGRQGSELPVRGSRPLSVAFLFLAGLLVALAYGWLLHRFTNAYAPYIDSLVLAFSVLGQFLLMGRRIETWWCWLVVNSISVPLYCSRGLYLTALLYLVFWINAAVSLSVWRRGLQAA